MDYICTSIANAKKRYGAVSPIECDSAGRVKGMKKGWQFLKEGGEQKLSRWTGGLLGEAESGWVWKGTGTAPPTGNWERYTQTDMGMYGSDGSTTHKYFWVGPAPAENTYPMVDVTPSNDVYVEFYTLDIPASLESEDGNKWVKLPDNIRKSLIRQVPNNAVGGYRRTHRRKTHRRKTHRRKTRRN